jgi:hypothetical protein
LYQNDELLCWDVRQLGNVLGSFRRRVRTNQRIAFLVSQDLLLSGQWCCCQVSGAAVRSVVLLSGQWCCCQVSGAASRSEVLPSGQWCCCQISGAAVALVPHNLSQCMLILQDYLLNCGSGLRDQTFFA